MPPHGCQLAKEQTKPAKRKFSVKPWQSSGGDSNEDLERDLESSGVLDTDKEDSSAQGKSQTKSAKKRRENRTMSKYKLGSASAA